MRVRSPYTEPVIVPWLGDLKVNPNQVVDIRDGTLPNFLEASWEPADAETKKAAAALAKAKQPQEPAPAGQEEG